MTERRREKQNELWQGMLGQASDSPAWHEGSALVMFHQGQ